VWIKSLSPIHHQPYMGISLSIATRHRSYNGALICALICAHALLPYIITKWVIDYGKDEIVSFACRLFGKCLRVELCTYDIQHKCNAGLQIANKEMIGTPKASHCGLGFGVAGMKKKTDLRGKPKVCLSPSLPKTKWRHSWDMIDRRSVSECEIDKGDLVQTPGYSEGI